MKSDEEKRDREEEGLPILKKPTPQNILLLEQFKSKFKSSPNLKPRCRASPKSISKGKENLIDGQMRLISRRGVITLTRPGSGLKGKFTVNEPGGQLRGVMGPSGAEVLNKGFVL